MKAISNFFDDKPINTEIILCSSDPNSLDGLILQNKTKKVAVIDGTSPHSAEPKYPGAVETIVNLGDFWNESVIESNREKILELNAMKKQFYDNAYEYLSAAKVCSDIVYDSIKKIAAQKNEFSSQMLPKTVSGNGKIEIRLYSAFGKDGFTELPIPCSDETKVYNFVGIYGSEYLFLETIAELAKADSLDLVISPSPLDKTKYDCICVKEQNLIFKAGKGTISKNATVIDTSKFINIKDLEKIRNKVETLYKEKEALLWSATDEFKRAYDTHINLEKIYSAAMNFKKNKRKIEKVCEQIESMLLESDINT